MKISGFSFIRNAVKFDYPIIEAITSILPICDEFVIAIGDSDDETRSLIESIDSPKIKIIDTIWDDSLRDGGKVLAKETDKAFRQISKDSTWAFYIQGDEVVHEKYLPVIKDAMERWKDDDLVEGLLFKYLHFYGSYDYVGNSRKWYRNEIRIIRNLPEIKAYRDAQGFRRNNKKIQVKPIDAYIYHYGWVKPPEAQQLKQRTFHKFWHSDDWMEKHIPNVESFDYSQIDSLEKFKDTHPKTMQRRVDNMNWELDFDPQLNNFTFKSLLLHKFGKWTGWRIGVYKNYKII